MWNSSTTMLEVSTNIKSYNTQLDSSIFVPQTIGGIEEGTPITDLKGDTFIQLFDDLLFPTVSPTIVGPSVTFVMAPTTTLYEVSTNILTLTFTTAFDRGSISNSSVFQNYRSGSVKGYDLFGYGLSDVSTSDLTDIQIINSYNVQLGDQNWSSIAYHEEGPQPYDNKGNPDGSPLPDGSIFASSQRTIEGAYPLYATTEDISTLTKQSLVSMSSNPAPSTNGITLVNESYPTKQKFEIPNAWLDENSLSGIKTFNTNNNQWEYELGNAALSLTRWDTSTSENTIQGYLIPYTRYIYNGPDRASIKIRLEF